MYGLSNIQRTMRLLATSTPRQRNRVRVLFYGQSITQSGWSRTVARELQRRFPHADLRIENRAIGGFSSEHLVKAAESDLYRFDPDLLVFHVYGSHPPYEDIVRRLRERTTAEILLQTDHITEASQLEEEEDPALLSPDEGSYDAFMNYAFLPRLAREYQAALCDQRSAWKRYLAQHKLPPAALLVDEVHLNGAGDALMAALVLRCLRYAPELSPSPLDRAVETVRIGRDVAWKGGKLRLAFRGSRVDAIVAGSGAAGVLIDDKRPSEWRELYSFTRARVNGAIWPPLYDIGSQAPLLLEDWTLHVERGTTDPAHYTFELIGSKSGHDGHGNSRERFVSNSGRVVIEPDDWNIEYAFELAGYRSVPPRFKISFSVEKHFSNTVRAPARKGERERIVTLAKGLPPGVHTLELRAPIGDAPVTALRIHRPLGSDAGADRTKAESDAGGEQR